MPLSFNSTGLASRKLMVLMNQTRYAERERRASEFPGHILRTISLNNMLLIFYIKDETVKRRKSVKITMLSSFLNTYSYTCNIIISQSTSVKLNRTEHCFGRTIFIKYRSHQRAHKTNCKLSTRFSEELKSQ